MRTIFVVVGTVLAVTACSSGGSGGGSSSTNNGNCPDKEDSTKEPSGGDSVGDGHGTPGGGTPEDPFGDDFGVGPRSNPCATTNGGSSGSSNGEHGSSGDGSSGTTDPGSSGSSGTKKKGMGDDCTSASECEDGKCLTFEKGGQSFGFCTKQCVEASDCPSDWDCNLSPYTACVPK